MFGLTCDVSLVVSLRYCFTKKKQARSVENRKYKSKTEKMLNKRLKI